MQSRGAMNPFEELKLHVGAVGVAVEANPNFFASVLHYVGRLKQLVSEPSAPPTQSELKVLAEKLEEFWTKWRPSGDGGYIPPRETSDTDSTIQKIAALVARLAALDQAEFTELTSSVDSRPERQGAKTRKRVVQPCVFLGHGRSRLWARVKVFLEEELRIATVTYESESHTGESIVPVLEKMLDQATFAVLVLTAEDETPEGGRRARQNVIHEAGLFQGRLGFRRAVLLVQGGVESFSNVAGLQHIPFSDQNVEQTFYELQRVLKRERQLSG
jgi:predicted nucleotide-binding protein